MLQGQQRLIDDMKNNFEKEMASVKEQMLRQQQLFQKVQWLWWRRRRPRRRRRAPSGT